MSARRGATTLSGILLVDKPNGVTSHDVVDMVRRATGERRVGHAGTLDPLATGLLVVLVGPAARLAGHLTSQAKSYEATVVFGAETDTDDADGSPTLQKPVPAQLADNEFARDAVAGLVGTHHQTPPAYSAIKSAGRKAYEMARAGEDVDLKPREIVVTSAELLSVDQGPPVRWNVALGVSKGTYIRAIARDLGRDLGTAAHLGALRRSASGELSVDLAHDPAELAEAADPARLFADPVAALGLPVVRIDDEAARLVRNGVRLDAEAAGAASCGDGPIAIVEGDTLLAIYDKAGATLLPATVLPGGVGGP